MPPPSWLLDRPFAHRGLHDRDAPENTLAAFEKAIAAGYGIEFDARLSRDGEAVVFHDARLERLTDLRGRVVDHAAAALTGAGIGGTRRTIPTLAAALALIAARVPVLIEVKSEGAHVGHVAHRVRERLEGYGGPCAVMSFNPRTTRWFARHAPDLPRGHLIRRTRLPRASRWGWEGRSGRALAGRALARMARCAFFGYDVRALPCRQAFGLRAAGVPLLAWTVRTSAERALAAAFADNFIFEAFAP